MADDSTYPHLLRKQEITASESTFSHPWNPKSLVMGTHLSGKAGLSRSGVSLVRIPSGQESFAYHMHHREEEWIYILSGRGVAVVDDKDYELRAGDFIAFPAPSSAHNMTNPFTEELVYLMGGENREYEIADFPKLDKRMIRRGDAIEIFNLSDAEPFGKSASTDSKSRNP